MGLISLGAATAFWGVQELTTRYAKKLRSSNLQWASQLIFLLPVSRYDLFDQSAVQDFTPRMPRQFWRDTIAKNPQAWMAFNNLGVILAGRGEFEEALEQFDRSLLIK